MKLQSAFHTVNIPVFDKRTLNDKRQASAHLPSAILAKDTVHLHFSGKHEHEALISEVKQDRILRFRELLKGITESPDEVKDGNDSTLLMLASRHGSSKCQQELLRRKANPALQNKQGDNALHLSAATGKGETMMIMLKHIRDLPNYRDILNQPNHKGQTPYMVAVNAHQTALAELLKAQGASTDAPVVPTKPRFSLMRHFMDKQPVSAYPVDIEDYLTEDAEEYLALRVKEDLQNIDERQQLKVRVRLAAQYQKDASPTIRKFWEAVCKKAVDKPIMEVINPPKRGLGVVAGMEDVIAELRAKVVKPYRYKMNPESFRRADGTMPYAKPRQLYGVLLHGPGGTGKSFIARQLVKELDRPVEYLQFSELGSKMYSETEQAIKQAFDTAAKQPPSFIIVDEIEHFLRDKNKAEEHDKKMINTFMYELEQARNKGITVIGTTNHKEMMELPAHREGRFDVSIHVSPPNKKARMALFDMYLPNATPDHKLPFSKAEREEFANRTRGNSAARIQTLCDELGSVAFDRNSDISPALMHELIEQRGPSYPKEIMDNYPNLD
jgi:ATP-dependent 26S proteasome regulatory subunit